LDVEKGGNARKVIPSRTAIKAKQGSTQILADVRETRRWFAV